MNSSELFLEIKKDLKPYKLKLKSQNLKLKSQKGNNDENINSIHRVMSKYNRENFNEIMNLSPGEFDDEIDEETVNDFIECIDHYFKIHSPNDDVFKEFIKAISLYLSFVAKKPLHPPGIIFSDGSRVFKNQDAYYCTGKSVFIQDEFSLCKYCVCKQSKSRIG